MTGVDRPNRAPAAETQTLNPNLQVLALELLKVLLENSGRVFASSEKFADGIKHYLCLSLLKNCASANPHALRLSCSIFLTLISKFRHSLKAEVGKQPRCPIAAKGATAVERAAASVLKCPGCMWNQLADGPLCGGLCRLACSSP
jgi:Guanine nucleotide exchange factor in Golgi transport N-terminal